MPEAAIAAPWIREDMIRAERSPEVVARRERMEASALAAEMRLTERHKERGPVDFYTSERARSREPLA
jgi:hypothetical protein